MRLNEFYVVCRNCGRISANEYSLRKQEEIMQGKSQNKSLADCARCGGFAHLVYRQEFSTSTAFDSALTRWQMTDAVVLKDYMHKESNVRVCVESLQTIRRFGDAARDTYLNAGIPVWEA